MMDFELNNYEKKILWLVTARSGSKSIPDKNIKLLGGNPLLSYRIKSALNTNYDFDLWISTDSRKYANLLINTELKFRLLGQKNYQWIILHHMM